MQQLAEKTDLSPKPADFLPLNGTDHVEFYVGNAKQAAYFYRAAFGMKLVAYQRTGDRHCAIAPRMWCSRARSASC